MRATRSASWLVIAVAAAGCTGDIANKGSAPDELPDDDVNDDGVGGAPVSGGRGGGGTGGQGGMGASPPAACTPTPLASRRLWVLSDTQFGNAIEDLVGVRPAGDVLAPATGGAPTAVSEATTVSGQAVFRYGEAAGASARAAVAKLDTLVSCPTRNEACAESFLRGLVPRAFRRPIPDSELAELMAVYRAGASEGFGNGLRLALEAVFQAPSFLYRSELGQAGNGMTSLTAHELAASVAFLLLDSVPDAALWAAAQDGTLVERDVLAREVTRLLGLPRVRANLGRVAQRWLGVGRVNGVVRDPKVSGDFPAALQKSLATSAARSVDDVLFGERFANLFTFSRIYADGAMTRFYGIPSGPTGTTLTAVDLPEGERGGGVITHPAVMAGIARPDDTDVVRRGLFVHHELLCGDDVPSPPPEVGPQIAAAANLPNERARAEARAKDPLCSGCHGSFDPYGVALERYDNVGRYRTTLGGSPIDAKIVLSGVSPELDGPIDGGVELGKKVAGSHLVWGCAVEQVAYQALGRAASDDGARCALGPVEDAFRRSGSFSDMVQAFIVSPAFAQRSLD